jgi:hypothetical protein
MRRLAAIATAFLIAFAPVLAAQTTADLSGKWTGTFITGEGDNDSAHIELKQKGTELTGTAGPNAGQQWPLKGKVDGNKVTFDVTHDQMVLKFALTYADGRLKGDATAERDGQTMTAKVDVGRAK